MPSTCPGTTYAEQIEADQARLQASGWMTHARYIGAMRLMAAAQLVEAEFLLAEHQLAIPWPAQAQHSKDHHADPLHRRG